MSGPVTLSVPGISCQHCRRAIEGALSEVPGLRGEVDVDARTVLLHLADGATLDQAVAAIEDQGYEVPARPDSARD